jgi:ABC-type transporter Mla subunit MlaD
MEEIQGFVRNLDEGLTELREHLRQRGLGALFDHPQMRGTLRELQGTLKAFHGVASEGQRLVQHGNESMNVLDRSLGNLDKSLSVVQKLLDSRSGDMDAIIHHLAGTLKELEVVSTQVRELLKDSGPELQENLKTLHRDLKSTEELLEILKAKPSRIVWGKPSDKEKDAAHQRVEEARKQDETKK